MFSKKFELGKLCKDRISGFKGIAVCESRWLNKCVRITLQPQSVNKDSTPTPNETFDIEQVEVIGAGLKIEAVPSGGPKPAPVRAKDPGR